MVFLAEHKPRLLGDSGNSQNGLGARTLVPHSDPEDCIIIRLLISYPLMHKGS